MPDKKKKKPQWELEDSLDYMPTLQDLVNMPPFREASDDAGHSFTAGARMPVWFGRRVAKLREMRGSPYEVSSDVYRDALWIGVKVIFLRCKTSPDWEVEQRMSRIVDTSSELRRIKESFQELETHMNEMYREGDSEQAAELLADYALSAAELTDVWKREKVFKLLSNSYTVRELAGYCNEKIRKLLSPPTEPRRLGEGEE